MKKFLPWLKRISALRISMVIAFIFAGMHFYTEADPSEYGFLSQKGFLRLLDLKALDIKFQGRKIDPLPEPKVVIAAIDEKSVDHYGLWPFSRNIVAQFIRKATEGGAKVIGFDAVFSDDDKNSSYRSIKRFLDAYEGASLRPESVRAQELQNNVREAERLDLETRQTLQDLEKSLRQQKGVRPGALATLDQVQKAVDKSNKNLQKARLALEESRKQAGQFYDTMAQEVANVSPDEAFANAVGASPQTVLGFFTFLEESEIVGIKKEEIEDNFKRATPFTINQVFQSELQDIGGQTIPTIRPAPEVNVANLQIRKIIALRAPLQKFSERAKGLAYFNVYPDPDGPLRRIWMFNRYEDKLYSALSLASAAKYLDGEIRPLDGDIKPGKTISGISLAPDVIVPTDQHGRFILNYYNDPEKYFPTYSVADFVEGTLPKDAIKDKVVLFGMTAQGLYDLRPNPFSPRTPGVYTHAVAVQNIIDQKYLERFFGMAIIEIVAYLLLGLLMGILLPRIPIWAGILATIGIIAAIHIIDVTLIFPKGIWTLTIFPSLEAVTIFIGTSVYGFFTEGREKRRIRGAFQFYLTKSVVDEVLKDPSKLKLGGERRVCTVLFSDVRGFTTISERLTPEELVHLLNSYLTPMTDIVYKYEGTLDKYMGDAIMAIFGAPVPYEDHAARACFTSLDMMNELKTLQATWRQQGLPEIDIGIGLNTGAMSVGNMGSNQRFDYTVMGDNVNLGSRLEGINKQYGTNIIISEFTYEAAKSAIHARIMDSVRVKGKKEPVRIYELLGRGEPTAEIRELISTFENGIQLYKGQKWDEAIATFEKVRTSLKPNDYASGMYIERCEEMRAEPPGADWDGVYTMKTK